MDVAEYLEQVGGDDVNPSKIWEKNIHHPQYKHIFLIQLSYFVDEWFSITFTANLNLDHFYFLLNLRLRFISNFVKDDFHFLIFVFSAKFRWTFGHEKK